MAVTRRAPNTQPPDASRPPQNLREYDPEFGRALYTGAANADVPHERMLSSIRVRVLLTPHYHDIDQVTGGVLRPLITKPSRQSQN